MSLSKGWSDEYRIALTKYIWVNNVWTELLTSSKHFWDLGKDQISEFNSQMSKATLRIPCLPNINKDTIDELFKWIQWISLHLKCSIINLFNVVTDHILRIHPQAGLSYKSQVQPRFRWFRAVVSHKKSSNNCVTYVMFYIYQYIKNFHTALFNLFQIKMCWSLFIQFNVSDSNVSDFCETSEWIES